MPISAVKIALLALGAVALSGCMIHPHGGHGQRDYNNHKEQNYGNQGYNRPPPPPPGQHRDRYNNNGYGN